MKEKLVQEKKPAPRPSYLQLSLLCLLSVSVYFNTLWHGFVSDDNAQILENPWITNFGNILDIFRSNVWGFNSGNSNFYRPVMHFVYMLDYRIFGLEPWGYHLINLLLNTSATLVVFAVTGRLIRESGRVFGGERYLPLLTAAIFAVHPAHIEAVAWVASLPELTYTLFYLMAFYFYMVSRDEGVQAGLAAFVSAALFFFAMLSKEPAATLPAVLFVYDYAVRKCKDGPWGYIRRYMPYLLALGVYLVIRAAALGGISPRVHKWDMSPSLVAINILPLFSQYMEKLLLPVNLNAYHEFHPFTSLSGPTVLIRTAVSVAIITALFLSLKKKSIWSVGLFLSAVPLIPSLYIPAVGRSVLCERYLYLPVFGFALLLSFAYVRAAALLPGLKKALGVVMAALVAVYAVGTVTVNRVWADDMSLWTYSVSMSPDNTYSHFALAKAYAKKGMLDNAIEESRIALSLGDVYWYAHVHSNLGEVYAEQGQLDKSVEELEQAIRLDPKLAAAHGILGGVYLNEGQLDRAAEELGLAIKLNPMYAEPHCLLGIVYMKKGLLDMAKDELALSIRLNPKLPEARYLLGSIYANNGHMDMAVEQFEEALKQKPGDAQLQESLRSALAASSGGKSSPP